MIRDTHSSSNNDISVPRPHTEIFKRSLAYAGPKLWNNIPLREVSNISAFKTPYEKICLKQYRYIVLTLLMYYLLLYYFLLSCSPYPFSF